MHRQLPPGAYGSGQACCVPSFFVVAKLVFTKNKSSSQHELERLSQIPKAAITVLWVGYSVWVAGDHPAGATPAKWVVWFGLGGG